MPGGDTVGIVGIRPRVVSGLRQLLLDWALLTRHFAGIKFARGELTVFAGGKGHVGLFG
jgi:hypothetical protein